MQNNAKHSTVKQCKAIQYNPMQSKSMQKQCNAIQCKAMRSFALLYSAVLCIALHWIASHCLHCFTLLRFALLSFALLCMVWHGFALLCFVLHWFDLVSCASQNKNEECKNKEMQGNAKPCKVDIKTCANSLSLSLSLVCLQSVFELNKHLFGVAPVSFSFEDWILDENVSRRSTLMVSVGTSVAG